MVRPPTGRGVPGGPDQDSVAPAPLYPQTSQPGGVVKEPGQRPEPPTLEWFAFITMFYS